MDSLPISEPIVDEWGVYHESCSGCGHNIVIVATVHSVDEGYAESFEGGRPLCMACQAQQKVGAN